MTQKDEPSKEAEEVKEDPIETTEEDSNSVGKVVDTIENTAQEAVESIYNYAKDLKVESIAYVLLAIGLFFIPFYPLWGGALVGLIFGCYYADAIVEAIRSFRSYFEAQSRAKSVALGGVVLALLMTLPTLFLGAAAAIGIISLVTATQSNDKKEEKK